MQGFTENEIKLFEKFKIWRDEHLEKSSTSCKRFNTLNISEEVSPTTIIQKIPKCLVHLTRKMCNCNRDCVGESFSNNGIDYECKAYDTDNLWSDIEYLDCDFLDKKVQDGRLVTYNTYYKLFKAINNLNNGLISLCDTKKHFRNLLCDAYDLRDGCRNIKDCIDFFLKKVSQNNCSNEDYTWEIEQIEKILGMKVRTEINEVQKENDCVPIVYFEDLDVILELYKNNNSKTIVKRELGEIDLPDYVFSDSKSIDSNISICQQNTFYYMISLSIVSTLVFFILVILGYDNNKNIKIIVPGILMSLFILFISIYITLDLE